MEEEKMGRFGSLMPKSGSDLPFWRALAANRFSRTNGNTLPGLPAAWAVITQPRMPHGPVAYRHCPEDDGKGIAEFYRS